MVREIVGIQVGQCGNQIGSRFWDSVRHEHELNGEGEKLDTFSEVHEQRIGVYFRATASDSKFTPRCVMVDLEPATLDNIKKSECGKMFKPDNFVSAAGGAGNNWAKGYYTEGPEIIDKVLDTVRKEVEDCDALQGFQISHSLGGGTGSGLGTLILSQVRETYPERITKTYSVYPSPKVADVVVEPYNSVLANHQLLENADQTYVIDNEALYEIATKLLGTKSPEYSFLNYLVATTMMGVTSSLRFSGKLNGDLRKLGVNMVPFPRLHFFNIAQAPLIKPSSSSHIRITCKELTSQVWSGKNFFSNVPIDEGKFLTAAMTFRGDIQQYDIDKNMNAIQDKRSEDFVEWIPNNIKSSCVSQGPKGQNGQTLEKRAAKSATFVTNTTALKGMFQRLATQFKALYRRGAFLYHFLNEGMDKMEFEEADKNVLDLITEYQDKEQKIDNDGEGDGDDSDE